MSAKGPPNLVPSADCLVVAQRNQKQSPLLLLPAELRTRVYDFTMDTNTDKILHDDHPAWDRLNFSRTSRQIFTETALPYLKTKLFPLHNARRCSFGGSRWQETMEKLTPSQKRCVTKVLLSWQQMREIFSTHVNPLVLALPHLLLLEVVNPGDYQVDQYEVGDSQDKIGGLMHYTNIVVQIIRNDKQTGVLILS